MWIFLNNSFLSIVAHRDNPAQLLVRARRKGDIERVFPDATVAQTVDADYRYRTWLPREQVAKAIYDQVRAIDYPNFKDSIEDRDRHDAYMDVWATMYRYQTDTLGRHRTRAP